VVKGEPGYIFMVKGDDLLQTTWMGQTAS